MFKKVFFQIHWFLGITAGLILSLMGVTGAIYSYDQQILKWLNQDSYVVEVAQTPKLTLRGFAFLLILHTLSTIQIDYNEDYANKFMGSYFFSPYWFSSIFRWGYPNRI